MDISKPRIVIRVEYYDTGGLSDWCNDKRVTQVVPLQPTNDAVAAYVVQRLQAYAELILKGQA